MSKSIDQLSNMPAKEITALVKKHTNAIAVHRDQLREIFDILETILESLDNGIGDAETGIRMVESALDTLSEQL